MIHWPPKVNGRLVVHQHQRAPVRRFEAMWLSQEGRCYYCSVDMIRPTDVIQSGRVHLGNMATQDHVIPKSKGGKRNRANLVLACSTCNRNKGDLTEAEFIEKHAKRLAAIRQCVEARRASMLTMRRKPRLPRPEASA